MREDSCRGGTQALRGTRHSGAGAAHALGRAEGGPRLETSGFSRTRVPPVATHSPLTRRQPGLRGGVGQGSRGRGDGGRARHRSLHTVPRVQDPEWEGREFNACRRCEAAGSAEGDGEGVCVKRDASLGAATVSWSRA